ncbi:diacylglycerol kinase [uncultured Mucilaginibacter sp.]|uniref:diacylglycerol kinase n=1 Tax=uncultured Mucilaginibacter sp. TaxID=797541 RepID=UPI0025FAEFA4|nr:diacylglycerol kinase family protein [uncultured Mucilaginibacter sp.]
MMKLIKSFGYAFKGMLIAIREEQNMRIHVVAIAVVTVCGIYLSLSAIEWAVIALTIGFVISMEMVNSAIEAIVDHISPEFNKEAGRIKDLAAGAVLVAAIVATVIAVYIFGNKIFNLIF